MEQSLENIKREVSLEIEETQNEMSVLMEEAHRTGETAVWTGYFIGIGIAIAVWTITYVLKKAIDSLFEGRWRNKRW